jgi:hypothetical protein
MRYFAIIFSVITLSLGCNPTVPCPDESDGAECGEVEEVEVAQEFDANEVYIDLDHLVLSVRQETLDGLKAVPRTNPSDVFEMLGKVSDHPMLQSGAVPRGESDEYVIAEDDGLYLRYRAWRNRLNLSDGRSFPSLNDADDPDMDAYLVEQTYEIARALGASEWDMGAPIVRFLSAWKHQINESGFYIEPVLEKERLARRVRFHRMVDGIPVGKDYIAATYSLDGRLRHLNMTWYPIDWSMGDCDSGHTRESFEAKVREFLGSNYAVAAGLQWPATRDGVVAYTCFRHDMEFRGYQPPNLMGCVQFIKRNSLGGATFETHEFEL